MAVVKYVLGALLCVCVGLAWSDEVVDVCFNYGCASQSAATLSEARLGLLRDSLALAASPEQERALLGLVMGSLYGWAGEQMPIHADKGGNYADEGESGSMDCIDHSLTTERFLQVLEKRHMLRFHRLQGRIKRVRHLIMEHNGVLIEETAALVDDEGARYVVDSWPVDNGQPAVILPLQNWMDGEGPDV